MQIYELVIKLETIQQPTTKLLSKAPKLVSKVFNNCDAMQVAKEDRMHFAVEYQ